MAVIQNYRITALSVTMPMPKWICYPFRIYIPNYVNSSSTNSILKQKISMTTWPTITLSMFSRFYLTICYLSSTDFQLIFLYSKLTTKPYISKGIHYLSTLLIKATVSTWHERIESTSFTEQFVQLGPPLFLPSQSYAGTYLLAMYF